MKKQNLIKENLPVLYMHDSNVVLEKFIWTTNEDKGGNVHF